MQEFVGKLWAFIRERKKFRQVSILIMLLLLGGLIMLTEGSVVATLSILCFNAAGIGSFGHAEMLFVEFQ